VRIRWRDSFGLQSEVAQTLDLSRNGILVPCNEAWSNRTRFWVTLPYDADDTTGLQPEMPARMVRTAHTRSGARQAALHLQVPHSGIRSKFEERRSSPRLPFSLPVTIRRDGAYAAEVTMTIDLSYVGVRFEATRFYAADDFVHVHIPSGSWAERGEIPGRVLRIDSIGRELANAAMSRNPRPHAIDPDMVTGVAVVWRSAADS
jgi:PilZ domain-containing protein